LSELPVALQAVTNQRVLAALIAHPLRAHHGAEIRIETGLPLRVIYPMLARLEALHWLDSDWEPTSSRARGRPRRRYYRLSTWGLAMARGSLASARSTQVVGGWRRWQMESV
jgi:DNA-binding PadR family transcriptional regulator